MSELDKKFNLVNEATPVGEYLSAHYKRFVFISLSSSVLTFNPFSFHFTTPFRSFGHYTIKDRLPVILTRILDNLSRFKEQMVAQRGEVK